jgi:hypothetical protein
MTHRWQGMTNAEHLADCERLERERKEREGRDGLFAYIATVPFDVQCDVLRAAMLHDRKIVGTKAFGQWAIANKHQLAIVATERKK